MQVRKKARSAYQEPIKCGPYDDMNLQGLLKFTEQGDQRHSCLTLQRPS